VAILQFQHDFVFLKISFRNEIRQTLAQDFETKLTNSIEYSFGVSVACKDFLEKF
jgi:hypothetical protein